ncbi:MAG TPA: double zinc ribbon domain-containing protein [Gemmatimonadaceae bacterium]|nr:double zinc ribbon domain-containing protein [Gemmatimonadaceae bacterium]
MVRNRARSGGDEGIARVGGVADIVRRHVAGAIDLLLPIACVSCESLVRDGEKGIVCTLCWSRLAMLPSPRCDRCGHPLQATKCQWCDLLPPFVRAVRSVCWMPGDPAATIVHALKYGGWTKVAAGMALRMSRLTWPRDVCEERSGIVPVPLAPSRTRERGYNQSALLALSLADRWEVPVWSDVIVRSRATRSQTELTPEQRVGNVAGSFQLVERARGRIRGRHIVLADDVVTTAATLNECARVLYAGGARIISYVTFGRARASGDRL